MTEREDRQDISDVLLRYATGIDRRDWRLFRTAFTDDCELDYGEIGTWRGIDAVTDFMETSHAMAGPTMHRLTNQVITVDGDSAQARTYVDGLIMFGEKDSGVNAVGFYDDEVVRTDVGWRIARRRFTLGARQRGGGVVTFAEKYGPWAVVAGASDGVGAAFAEGLAERGVSVVLLARRQAVLDEVAAGIESRHGVRTRTLTVDLAHAEAATTIAEATADLEVGLLVHCAGADPDFGPFLANPVATAEAMIQRNCTALVQLCHHFAPAMVARGSGGIVVFGSGAGFVGAPNMVAYGATKAFDMVFAEALWSELHDKGVDVLGLILGKTDTPALRRLERDLGTTDGDAPPADAATVDDVITEAFDNLGNGPTHLVGETMRAGMQMLTSLPRNDAVQLMIAASAASMGPGKS